MLVLSLYEPDAAKIIGLVCPSVVAYPDAMATTVAIKYLTGAVHTYPDIFDNGDFFLPFSFQSTCIQRFQAPKNRRFSKPVPRVE